MIELGTIIIENGIAMVRTNYFHGLDVKKEEYHVSVSEIFKSDEGNNQVKEIVWSVEDANGWLDSISVKCGCTIIEPNGIYLVLTEPNGESNDS